MAAVILGLGAGLLIGENAHETFTVKSPCERFKKVFPPNGDFMGNETSMVQRIKIYQNQVQQVQEELVIHSLSR